MSARSAVSAAHLMAGCVGTIVGSVAAGASASDATAPAFPVGSSVWPAPGDPWPDPLQGPVTLFDPAGEIPAPGAGFATLRGGAAAGVGAPDPVPTLGAALPTTADGVGAGACYAEVLVPERWRLEPVEVVVREAGERFEVTPPVLVETTREVVVRDAHERLTAVAPVMRTESRSYEHVPATSRLVRDTADGVLPAAPAELRAIGATGIDPDGIPSGSCVHEWYEAPAVERTVRRVMTSQAHETLDIEPARFEEVELPVETAPAHVRLVEIPAAWADTERKVLVEPATVTWEPGEGLIERIDQATGQLMCRVDVPARHTLVPGQDIETPAMITAIDQPATVETLAASRLVAGARELRRTVPATFDGLALEAPASGAGDWTWLPDGVRPLDSAHELTGRAICRQPVPAVIASWEREMVETPGRFEREAVPAETTTVSVLELAAKATGTPVPVPAKTVRVTRRTHLGGARLEWRPVLCRTNVTTDVVRRLQGALDAAGHSPGGVDGLLGPGTMSAVADYQRDRALPVGGLTLETLESLGVALAPVTSADAER